MSVQRTERPLDESLLNLIIDLGLEVEVPIVATNAVQFIDQNDSEAHEARICIAEGGLLDDARRSKNFSNHQYLKTSEEMMSLFEDYPQVIENSSEIAKRCNLHFELFEKNYLPLFPTPDGMSIADFFSQESKKGLELRLKDLKICLLYTSPSPRDRQKSRMPSSA